MSRKEYKTVIELKRMSNAYQTLKKVCISLWQGTITLLYMSSADKFTFDIHTASQVINHIYSVICYVTCEMEKENQFSYFTTVTCNESRLKPREEVTDFSDACKDTCLCW